MTIFRRFDTRWDEILLSVEQLPPDDILERPYKLRIRESEKLTDRIGIVQLGDQKKSKPDYHRLKTMVKRSIEQDLRTRNFEARNGRIESNMLVKNHREQRHVLEGQGDCWQWKAIGQCSKGNNCSFRHDANKRAKPTTQPAPSPKHPKSQEVKDSAKAKSPRGRSPSEKITRMPCKDHLKGTCANPSCEKWHSPECSLYTSAEGCKFGDKCAFAHRWVEDYQKGLKEVATKVQLLS